MNVAIFNDLLDADILSGSDGLDAAALSLATSLAQAALSYAIPSRQRRRRGAVAHSLRGRDSRPAPRLHRLTPRSFPLARSLIFGVQLRCEHERAEAPFHCRAGT